MSALAAIILGGGEGMTMRDVVKADALLGALLVSGSRVAALLANELSPSDFPDETTVGVFRAIASLAGRGRTSDPLSVFDELNQQGRPCDVAAVLEASLQRAELIQVRQALASAVREMPPISSELAVVSAQALLGSEACRTTLPTGIAWVDDATNGGLTRGEITVVAQRPWLLSDGLLETAAATLAVGGNSLLIVTNRSRQEIVTSIVARYAGRGGDRVHEESPRYMVARAFINAVELTVEPPALALDRLVRTGPHADVIIVEGVHGPFESYAEALSGIARRRSLAILALAPLPATPKWVRDEQHGDWRPRLEELPLSVREHVATTVLALRPWFYQDNGETNGEETEGHEMCAAHSAVTDFDDMNAVHVHVHRARE